MQDAAVSSGGMVALHVTRPFSAGGEFLGPPSTLFDPRGDLWLLNATLECPSKLPSLSGGAWAPCFSPDGGRLCALTMVGPGKVGVALWELSGDRWRVFSDVNVDIMLPQLRTAMEAYAGPGLYSEMPKRYIWVGEGALVLVDHGQPQQLLLALSGLSEMEEELRRRSEGGKRSVRVWGSGSPTCGAGSSLVKLNLDTGEVDPLYEGDVRGVSLSPDGRLLAAMVATRNIPPPPDRPMQWPLRGLTAYDDGLVELGLVLLELAPDHRRWDIHGIDAVGNVAPSRLPRWSVDSGRLAVPVRTTYSDAPSTGNDAAWEVVAGTGTSRKWSASSALDSELLAALLTTDGLNNEKVIRQRPQRIRGADYSEFGQIDGGAWRGGPGLVVFWNAPEITLITAQGPAKLPGRFSSVQPPVWNAGKFNSVVIRADQKGVLMESSPRGVRLQPLDVPKNASLLALNPREGAAIYAEDRNDGTFLRLARASTCSSRSPLCFNTYFRNVRQPGQRLLMRRFEDGSERAGLLLLPTDHRSGDRHPVIVWAYPNSKPALDDLLTQPNSYVSEVYPIQYLLSRGFAFFQAPFPISGKRSHHPMRAAVEAVLPWLDELSAQPEIIPEEYGVFGHSNAGYVALALEAFTNRFKAIVAWDTFPQLGYNTLHASREDEALDCAANLVQGFRMFYEPHGQPYAPRPVPPWKDPRRYIRNDPLFDLDGASTPLLLIEGEFDVAPAEMEEVYSTLYGKGVPVELAYYWDEGHVFGSPGNIRDSWRRTERFFRRYLKMR